MKCTNCGNNNASYHYKYDINGKVTESHLCAECAKELQPEKEFAAKRSELFKGFEENFFNNSIFDRDFFDRGFFGNNIFEEMRRSFFGNDLFSRDFFGRGFFPTLAFAVPVGISGKAEAPEKVQDKKPEEKAQTPDPELMRIREINSLREQMKAAAEAENYEKAAELRDKIRSMENPAD